MFRTRTVKSSKHFYRNLIKICWLVFQIYKRKYPIEICVFSKFPAILQILFVRQKVYFKLAKTKTLKPGIDFFRNLQIIKCDKNLCF